MGEVISDEEFQRRYKCSLNQNHLYMMKLDANHYIDARHKSNKSRFVNHSCFPNSTLELWNVKGRLRVGMFAIRAINIGDEIVADYEWDVSVGRRLTRCLCGSTHCRRFLEKANRDLADGEDDDDWMMPAADFDPNIDPIQRKTIQIWRAHESMFQRAVVRSNTGLKANVRWLSCRKASGACGNELIDLHEVTWLLRVRKDDAKVGVVNPKKKMMIDDCPSSSSSVIINSLSDICNMEMTMVDDDVDTSTTVPNLLARKIRSIDSSVTSSLRLKPRPRTHFEYPQEHSCVTKFHSLTMSGTEMVVATHAGTVTCNCRKSRCLKLFCECFAAKRLCSKSCSCMGCDNHLKTIAAVRQAMESIQDRNPNAFVPKFGIMVCC